LFEASGVVSVAFEPGTERFIAAYSTPLSSEITLRSGLGPDGPWSGPHVVATCNLPASDPGAFCADVVLHPALAYPGELVLTHGVGSFDRPEGTAPEEIRARLATFPVPSSLP